MFAKRLKELRTEAKYSMDKCVMLYNEKFDGKMNKSTLSRYENNLQKPIYDVIVNLASLFNVSTDYILGNSDNKHRKIKLKDINNIVPDYESEELEIELKVEANNVERVDEIKQFLLDNNIEFAIDFPNEKGETPAIKPVEHKLTDNEKIFLEEINDLTEEEQQKVLDFIHFTKSQRTKRINLSPGTELAAFGGDFVSKPKKKKPEIL